MIKYKKGGTNKLADMLSRPPKSNIIGFGTHMDMEPFTHDAYTEDEKFKDMLYQLKNYIHVHNGDHIFNYHLYNRLLYRLDKSCVPKGD